MDKNILKYYKTNSDVKSLEYATQGSACFDISAYFTSINEIVSYTEYNTKKTDLILVNPNGVKYINLYPQSRLLCPTGLIFEIPQHYSLRLHARSGKALKHGICLANSEGVIDSDYREEVYVILINNSNACYRVLDGERIAQGELVKNNFNLAIEETFTKPIRTTNRIGGMGSTGI